MSEKEDNILGDDGEKGVISNHEDDLSNVTTISLPQPECGEPCTVSSQPTTESMDTSNIWRFIVKSLQSARTELDDIAKTTDTSGMPSETHLKLERLSGKLEGIISVIQNEENTGLSNKKDTKTSENNLLKKCHEALEDIKRCSIKLMSNQETEAIYSKTIEMNASADIFVPQSSQEEGVQGGSYKAQPPGNSGMQGGSLGEGDFNYSNAPVGQAFPHQMQSQLLMPPSNIPGIGYQGYNNFYNPVQQFNNQLNSMPYPQLQPVPSMQSFSSNVQFPQPSSQPFQSNFASNIPHSYSLGTRNHAPSNPRQNIRSGFPAQQPPEHNNCPPHMSHGRVPFPPSFRDNYDENVPPRFRGESNIDMDGRYHPPSRGWFRRAYSNPFRYNWQRRPSYSRRNPYYPRPGNFVIDEADDFVSDSSCDCENQRAAHSKKPCHSSRPRVRSHVCSQSASDRRAKSLPRTLDSYAPSNEAPLRKPVYHEQSQQTDDVAEVPSKSAEQGELHPKKDDSLLPGTSYSSKESASTENGPQLVSASPFYYFPHQPYPASFFPAEMLNNSTSLKEKLTTDDSTQSVPTLDSAELLQDKPTYVEKCTINTELDATSKPICEVLDLTSISQSQEDIPNDSSDVQKNVSQDSPKPQREHLKKPESSKTIELGTSNNETNHSPVAVVIEEKDSVPTEKPLSVVSSTPAPDDAPKKLKSVNYATALVSHPVRASESESRHLIKPTGALPSNILAVTKPSLSNTVLTEVRPFQGPERGRGRGRGRSLAPRGRGYSRGRTFPDSSSPDQKSDGWELVHHRSRGSNTFKGSSVNVVPSRSNENQGFESSRRQETDRPMYSEVSKKPSNYISRDNSHCEKKEVKTDLPKDDNKQGDNIAPQATMAFYSAAVKRGTGQTKVIKDATKSCPQPEESSKFKPKGSEDSLNKSGDGDNLLLKLDSLQPTPKRDASPTIYRVLPSVKDRNKNDDLCESVSKHKKSKQRSKAKKINDRDIPVRYSPERRSGRISINNTPECDDIDVSTTEMDHGRQPSTVLKNTWDTDASSSLDLERPTDSAVQETEVREGSIPDPLDPSLMHEYYMEIMEAISWDEQMAESDRMEKLISLDKSDPLKKLPLGSLDFFEGLVRKHPVRAEKVYKSLLKQMKLREAQEKSDAKIRQVREKRQQLLQDKTAKMRELVQKVEEVKAAQYQLALLRKSRIESKHKKAEENRKMHLSIIRRKAHDEEEKLREIAFINELEAQNRRHDSLVLRQEHEERIQYLIEERLRKLEEKAAKEAAVEERKRLLEAERKEKVERLREKSRQKEEIIGRKQQEREQERLEIAREKAREREERLLARQALQLASAEELQKRIQQKQEESARRHEESMKLIRQKALEVGLHRMIDEYTNNYYYFKPGDVKQTRAVMPSGEKLKAMKKRAKKIKTRMALRASEFLETFSYPEVNAESKHIIKYMTDWNDFLECISVDFNDNQLNQLDNILSDIEAYLCTCDKIWFRDCRGLFHLGTFMRSIANSLNESIPGNLNKCIKRVTSIYIACTSDPALIDFIVRAMDISSFIDILKVTLSGLSVKKNMDVTDAIFRFIKSVFDHYAYIDHLPSETIMRLQDLISYMICSGALHKLMAFYSLANVESSVTLKELIPLSLDLLSSFLLKQIDSSEYLNLLVSSDILGTMPLLYEGLQQDLKSTPPYSLNVFKLLLNFASTDIKLFQKTLGGQGMSLQFRSITRAVMDICISKTNSEDLLHAVIEIVGYFSHDNRENQDLILSGPTPTVLQHLVHLPFKYYCEPKYMAILFPTIICCTKGNPTNIAIIENEMSLAMLDEFTKTDAVKTSRIFQTLLQPKKVLPQNISKKLKQPKERACSTPSESISSILDTTSVEVEPHALDDTLSLTESLNLDLINEKLYDEESSDISSKIADSCTVTPPHFAHIEDEREMDETINPESLTDIKDLDEDKELQSTCETVFDSAPIGPITENIGENNGSEKVMVHEGVSKDKKSENLDLEKESFSVLLKSKQSCPKETDLKAELEHKESQCPTSYETIPTVEHLKLDYDIKSEDAKSGQKQCSSIVLDLEGDLCKELRCEQQTTPIPKKSTTTKSTKNGENSNQETDSSPVFPPSSTTKIAPKDNKGTKPSSITETGHKESQCTTSPIPTVEHLKLDCDKSEVAKLGKDQSSIDSDLEGGLHKKMCSEKPTIPIPKVLTTPTKSKKKGKNANRETDSSSSCASSSTPRTTPKSKRGKKGPKSSSVSISQTSVSQESAKSPTLNWADEMDFLWD